MRVAPRSHAASRSQPLRSWVASRTRGISSAATRFEQARQGSGPGRAGSRSTSTWCSRGRSVCFVEGAAPGHARNGSLGSRAIATNTAAAHTMYPHDALSNDVYARVVEKLNGSRPFAELPAGEQLETLK